ncbi:MAG: hypothetical protein RLZZ70_315 [Candidatus Parcubacteria bacterium]
MTSVYEQNYFSAYNRLNKKQKSAVDAIEGPVMVIAGPGTGKTQILTLRIANILRLTDTAPESILALTFTKSGARAMRERLQTFIGPRAYQVPIYTFHALAEQLIREYPTAYERIVGGQAITDIERIQYLESILEDPALSLLRPVNAPDFYIQAITSAISAMKQENVTPHRLSEIISDAQETLLHIPQYHEKGAHKGKERSEYKKAAELIEKQLVLHAVYQRYDALMSTNRRYDFDDMILETVKVLRDCENVRFDLQERFQYILADEHQDVNGAQNEILELLTNFHTAPNLFVVGDEKQAIYRFQGASLENFIHFEQAYTATNVITLDDNYRSTQGILDQAHDLIKVTEGPLVDYRTPLQAASTDPEKMTLQVYSHESVEEAALVTAVQAELAAGVPPNEIAVIVRSNREVAVLADALRRSGVLVDASADGDILDHPLFLAAIDLLQAAEQPTNIATLAKVIQAPYWGIPLTDVTTLLAAQSYKNNLVQLLSSKEAREGLVLVDEATCTRVMTVLEKARASALVSSAQHVVADLFLDSGLLTYVIGRFPIEGGRIIRRVYDEIEGAVAAGEVRTLSEVVHLFTARVAYRLPLSAPYMGSGTGVQVITAHKSKGLEFHSVYVPHLTEQAWGKSKRPDYFKLPLLKTTELQLEANEDERRLLYVALTRAKTNLSLSYAHTNTSGKALSPTPLLSYLSLVPTLIDDEVLHGPTLLSQLISTNQARAELTANVQSALTRRGFSATSLNNALKNPWHFVYRNVFRLPEPKTPALHFGTAMHGVLEQVTKTHTATAKILSFNDANRLLVQRLEKLPLSPVEMSDLLQKGQASLAAYLPHLTETLPAMTKEEFSSTARIQTNLTLLPELLLQGNLDRLDFAINGSVSRVVDYKTGKTKSRKDIMGETATSDGNYRRQLSFYALLLSLHEDNRYHCPYGVLSFIEPHTNGKIVEELFESDSENQAGVKAEILETLEMLLRGDFWFDEILAADSEYASLATLLQDRLRT